jgi:hypothetical protein
VKRALAIVTLCLAGCDEPASDEPAPDAGTAIGLPAELGTGGYDLEWTCVEGCILIAPFAYYDRLDVTAELLLTFSRTGAGSVDDQGELDDHGCVVGLGIAVGDYATDPYSFCPKADGPTATVDYDGRPGPVDAQRRYVVRASPR